MRFYYISIISVILLFVIWFVGTGLLAWLGSSLRKSRKRVWPVMLPLFLLLYLGPIAEELWIAWNFGQLCKKDAGILITRTVEVDGFYDATAVLTKLYNPLAPQAAEYYEKTGFRFYELGLSQPSGGANKVVHIEKLNGVWTPTVLDQPTARYHYTANIYGSRAAHKITRQESTVTDQLSGEVIGRYVEYGRRSPWFYVGLGEPPYSCDGPDGGPNSKQNRLIYRDVLKPKQR